MSTGSMPGSSAARSAGRAGAIDAVEKGNKHTSPSPPVRAPEGMIPVPHGSIFVHKTEFYPMKTGQNRRSRFNMNSTSRAARVRRAMSADSRLARTPVRPFSTDQTWLPQALPRGGAAGLGCP